MCTIYIMVLWHLLFQCFVSLLHWTCLIYQRASLIFCDTSMSTEIVHTLFIHHYYLIKLSGSCWLWDFSPREIPFTFREVKIQQYQGRSLFFNSSQWGGICQRNKQKLKVRLEGSETWRVLYGLSRRNRLVSGGFFTKAMNSKSWISYLGFW